MRCRRRQPAQLVSKGILSTKRAAAPERGRSACENSDQPGDGMSEQLNKENLAPAPVESKQILSPDEEKQLWYRIEDGDSEAYDRIVRANFHLVVKVAASYDGHGLDLQELIQHGKLGLLRAIEAFDPSTTAPFSTYANYWINQAIKGALPKEAAP